MFEPRCEKCGSKMAIRYSLGMLVEEWCCPVCYERNKAKKRINELEKRMSELELKMEGKQCVK